MGRAAPDLEQGRRSTEAADPVHATGEGGQGSGESVEQTGCLPGQSGETYKHRTVQRAYWQVQGPPQSDGQT